MARPNFDWKLIGEAIAQARQRRGLSRTALADSTKAPGQEPVSEKTIQRLEAGASISVPKLKALCGVLEIPFDRVAGWDASLPPWPREGGPPVESYQPTRGQPPGIKPIESRAEAVAATVRLLASDRTRSTLHQTFLYASPVSPMKDALTQLLGGPEHPYVNRLVGVASPLDLNFAQHCLDIASRHHERMQLTILDLTSFGEFLGVHPNFLVADEDTTLLLFSSRGPFLRGPGRHECGDGSTHGVLIHDRDFARHMRIYYQELAARGSAENAVTLLDDLKQRLWARDRRHFLTAVGGAIAIELTSHPLVSKRLKSVSVVGSTVHSGSPYVPQDLDLLVVLSSIPLPVLRALRESVVTVLRRFSSHSLVFAPSWTYGPGRTTDTQKEFPVQVIVHDRASAVRTSPFIRYDRAFHHLDMYGELTPLLGDISFGPADVVKGPRGLREVSAALRQWEVKIWTWTEEGGRPVRKEANLPVMGPRDRSDLVRYAVRWTVINSLRGLGVSAAGLEKRNPDIGNATLRLLCSTLGLNPTPYLELGRLTSPQYDEELCSKVDKAGALARAFIDAVAGALEQGGNQRRSKRASLTEHPVPEDHGC